MPAEMVAVVRCRQDIDSVRVDCAALVGRGRAIATGQIAVVGERPGRSGLGEVPDQAQVHYGKPLRCNPVEGCVRIGKQHLLRICENPYTAMQHAIGNAVGARWAAWSVVSWRDHYLGK
jgi:hypothetical protein